MTFGDTHRVRLRRLVEANEHELAGSTEAASPTLRALWTDLLAALALGPAPELRACPACSQLGMRAASRCGHCWIAIVPMPSDR